MKGLIERIKNEPAVFASIIAAVIALFAAFGVSLTDEQVGAIMTVVVLVLGFVVRQQVTPVHKLEQAASTEATRDEVGAYDGASILIALACLVIILCGLVWLLRAF